MASDPPTLGTRIRRARERARLSQEELASAVGASTRAVGDWENDRRKPRNRLGALEEVLGVSLEGESAQEKRSALDDLVGPDMGDHVRQRLRERHGRDAPYYIRLLEESVTPPPPDEPPGPERRERTAQ